MNKCNFDSAQMECVILTDTFIKECIFDEVILDGCFLNEAKCEGTTFRGTHFVGAILDSATFYSCDFTNADFTRADLNGITLLGDNIWKDCSMEGAVLSNVKMTQFNFDDEQIRIMLSEADLRNANWDGVSNEIKGIFIK